MEAEGYVENWITYGNQYFAAKELTVLPGRTVTIRDAGPYGFIAAGARHDGRLADRDADPDPLRPVDARRVLRLVRGGAGGRDDHQPEPTDPIVMLKHFGPNPDAPAAPQA